MKKYAASALAALLVCTGCQPRTTGGVSDSASDEAAGGSVIVTEEPEPTAQADASEETQPAVTISGSADEDVPHIDVERHPAAFRGTDSYFFFNTDHVSGSTLSFENGTGAAFEYENLGDGNFVIHMGAADNTIKAFVDMGTVNVIDVTLEDGTTDRLVFVGNQTADEFRFYTNEELRLLARAYYKAQTGYEPQCSDVQNNDDGTAVIHLYDQIDDHNSTSAWYTIDRVKLTGTDDIALTEVDFNEVVSALDEAE